MAGSRRSPDTRTALGGPSLQRPRYQRPSALGAYTARYAIRLKIYESHLAYAEIAPKCKALGYRPLVCHDATPVPRLTALWAYTAEYFPRVNL